MVAVPPSGGVNTCQMFYMYSQIFLFAGFNFCSSGREDVDVRTLGNGASKSLDLRLCVSFPIFIHSSVVKVSLTAHSV